MYALNYLTLLVTAATALPGQLSRRTDISAFDLSEYQGPDFMACMANQGFGKAIVRGYEQDCTTGGRVNDDFVPLYTSARAAGLLVDSYFFPCTGNQSNGIPCKDMETQLDEFLTTISENGMELEYLWFDLEPTNDECNAWNLGAEANAQLAQQWIAAINDTAHRWGIYGNRNQWTAMFPSQDTDVGSSLPLWACQPDQSPGVSSVETFMGGWTTAFAKQYAINTVDSVCGGSIDLDSFSA